jgi:pimeloyl-ACP methyl ester carboxylesterase
VPIDRPAGVREEFVDTARARVRVWRGGDGEPLVVVTDCGDPLELWSSAYTALTDRFALTMIEQPGFGYSDAGPGFDYRWDAHLDALRSVVDQLDVRAALGIGHCVAGTQLLAVDAAERGRLRAVVLAETFPAARYRDTGTGLLMHRVARLPGVGEMLTRAGGARGARRGARSLLRTLAADSAWVTDAVLDAYLAPIDAGHNRDGGLAHVRRWNGAVAEPVERSSRLPAAYLFGAGGHFARHLPEREHYASECGRSVAVLPDAGHFLFAEQPEAFAVASAELLAALQAGSDR